MLTLASRSPQRRAILTQLGVDFVVQPADVEELTGGEPRELVLENALRKAAAVTGELVLGVDTEVHLEGEIFGKARDEAQARSYLERLSGREHEVWSGIALRSAGGGELTAAAMTLVRFRTLGREWLDWYVASGEWRDRAGAYAIQGLGSALVERVEGDFWNVVGLPVYELVRLAPDLFLHARERQG